MSPPSETLINSRLLKMHTLKLAESVAHPLWLSATWIMNMSHLTEVAVWRLTYTQCVKCEGLHYCCLKCADVSPHADSA
jgi:hypothetical protein